MIIGARADIIRSVDADGFICGDFTIAHHDDCRFVNEQPEQLKRQAIVGDSNEPETIKRLASDTTGLDQFVCAVKAIADAFNYPVGVLAVTQTFTPKQK